MFDCIKLGCDLFKRFTIFLYLEDVFLIELFKISPLTKQTSMSSDATCLWPVAWAASMLVNYALSCIFDISLVRFGLIPLVQDVLSVHVCCCVIQIRHRRLIVGGLKQLDFIDHLHTGLILWLGNCAFILRGRIGIHVITVVLKRAALWFWTSQDGSHQIVVYFLSVFDNALEIDFGVISLFAFIVVVNIWIRCIYIK